MFATVAELWRYPVKSLLGEQLPEVEVDERGVIGDRLYAVTDRDGKLGSGKTSNASAGSTVSSISEPGAAEGGRSCCFRTAESSKWATRG